MSVKRFFYGVLVLLISLVWVLGAPTDALALKQVSPLRGPDSFGDCTGTIVGQSVIQGPRESGNTLLKVKFRSGPPNTTFNVFWVCTNIANGCHANACGFINEGTVTTDATGFGVFKKIIPGNRFPGSPVHLDVLDTRFFFEDPTTLRENFTSTFGLVPLGAGGGEGAAGAGAPSN
jgi:hypothetical protein